MHRLAVLLVLLSLSACGGPRPSPSATVRSVECAPYAREVSGIQLFGPAAGWWPQAEGRYARQHEPAAGAVLVFRSSNRLPSGHVSVVLRQVAAREIRVTQANWVHGEIADDEPVIDVSAANDWSEVRVWWSPIHTMGTTVYPAHGFILPDRPN